MRFFRNKKTTQITNLIKQESCRTFLIVLVFFINSNNSKAQNYKQFRVGYVHQPYKALNPEILDRVEHDYLGGFMLDFEFGN